MLFFIVWKVWNMVLSSLVFCGEVFRFINCLFRCLISLLVLIRKLLCSLVLKEGFI